jgi:hypothetical protein
MAALGDAIPGRPARSASRRRTSPARTRIAIYVLDLASSTAQSTPNRIDRAAGGQWVQIAGKGVAGGFAVETTLAVGGAATFSSTLAAGATTLASAAITAGATVGTTLGVTGAANFSSTVAVAGVTTVTNATASSSTSTGALVVAGGVGVGGQLTAVTVKATTLEATSDYLWGAGGNARIRSNTADGSDTLRISLCGGGDDAPGRGGTVRAYGNDNGGADLGGGVYLIPGSGADGNVYMSGGVAPVAPSSSQITAGAGAMKIGATTASTTTGTGALVVSGGLGVAGALNVGGLVRTTGSLFEGPIAGGLTTNAYFSGGWKYRAGGVAYKVQDGGSGYLALSAAASGLTDAAITWVDMVQVAPAGVGIGGGSNSTAVLTLGQTNPLTGTTQIGCFVNIVGTTAGTTALRGAQFSLATAAGAYTCTDAVAFLALNIAKGAGSTITRATGAWIDPQGNGTGNCGLLISSSLSYTGNWALRSESTAASYLAGSLTVADTTASSSTTTGALVVGGGVGVAGKAYIAGYTSIGTNTDPANAGERLTVCSPTTKATATTASVAYFCTGDTPGTNDLAFIMRLGCSATAGARWTGLQSYEQGTGARALVFQDLGGNVLIGSTTDDGTNKLQVAGSAAFSQAKAGTHEIQAFNSSNNAAAITQFAAQGDGGRRAYFGVTSSANASIGGTNTAYVGSNGTCYLLANDAVQASIDTSGINLASGKVLRVNATQVVAARDTGWTAMTGSSDKATAYATSTVTLAQLAGRVMALQAALTTHGLLGA